MMNKPEDGSRSTELLAMLTSSTQFASTLLDRDFNFLWVNRAYASASNREPDYFIGKNHFDLFLSNAIKLFEEVRRSKQPLDIRARPFDFPGEPERLTTYWDWKLEPVLDEGEEVVAFLFSLQDVTERYRTHLDVGMSGVAILDGNNQVLDVNKTLCDMVGRTRAQLRGASWTELLHQAERQDAGDSLGAWGAATSEPWKRRSRLAGTGAARHAQLIINKVIGNQGEVDYQILYMHDLTAEVRVRTQKQRYFELSVDMLCIASFDGYFVELNSAWQATLGFSREELMAVPFIEFVHPDDRELTLRESERLAAKPGATKNFHNRYRTRNGAYRWFVWNATANTDTLEIYATARDITDVKAYEAELVEHRKHLQSLVEERTTALLASESRTLHMLSHGPAVLYSRVPHGEFAANYVSPNVASVLGYGSDQFTEQPSFWADHIHPEDAAGILSNLGKLFEDGSHVHEYRFLHADGDYRWMRDELRLTRDEAGNPEKILGYWVDISDRREKEELLRHAKRLAEKANHAKSGFLSRMSHELRTPMNAILGFSELLELDASQLSDSQSESVTRIQDAGRHLLTLIDGILQLAKIDAGEEEINPEAVSVEDLVERCFVLVQPMVKRHVIRLSAQLESGIYVHADAVRLKQILVNLLSNAIKYNREHGEVLVRAEQHGVGRVRISVQDTGIGIEEVAQRRLFEPFYRVNVNTPVEGSGIGLSICRNLAQSMNGQMGLESRLGEGSTFWLELDCDEAPQGVVASPSPQSRSSETALPGAGKHVLYVEDNAPNRRLMEMIFKKYIGGTLSFAEAAEPGIAAARDVKPDLILMDLNLPGIDGFEALGILQQDARTKEIPVVAVSAHGMEEHVERARVLGFSDYLVKPISVSAVVSVIQKELSG